MKRERRGSNGDWKMHTPRQKKKTEILVMMKAEVLARLTPLKMMAGGSGSMEIIACKGKQQIGLLVGSH